MMLLPIVLAQVALFAGGPVNISCHNLAAEGYGGFDGLAWKSERRIQINDPLCLSVNRFANDHVLRSTSYEAGSSSENDPAWSMLTIAHEAEHVRHPDYSESRVQCLALARVARFALALGASQNVATAAERDAARWASTSPANYRRRCVVIRTPPRIKRRGRPE